MGGLWEGLAEEAEGPCFKGLMVTVDKEWVGILAEEYLPSSFYFLACWGLRDDASALLSPLFLPCTPDQMKGLFMDLSSAERMSIGDKLSASAS